MKVVQRADAAHSDGIWSVAWGGEGDGTIISGSVDTTVKMWNPELAEQHDCKGHQVCAEPQSRPRWGPESNAMHGDSWVLSPWPPMRTAPVSAAYRSDLHWNGWGGAAQARPCTPQLLPPHLWTGSFACGTSRPDRPTKFSTAVQVLLATYPARVRCEFVTGIPDCVAVECWTLAFTADSKHLASGSHSGAVNLWDIATGMPHTATRRIVYTPATGDRSHTCAPQFPLACQRDTIVPIWL